MLMQSVGRQSHFRQDRIQRFEDRLETELKSGKVLTRSQLYSKTTFAAITAAPSWHNKLWVLFTDDEKAFTFAMQMRCETPGNKAFDLVVAAFGSKPVTHKTSRKRGIQVLYLTFLLAYFYNNRW
jgi:hypothetical protein